MASFMSSTGGGGTSTSTISPQPMAGKGPFGMVPGQLPTPNPYGDLSKVLPGLPGLNQAGSSALLSELGGQLSPETINSIQDAAARWGVSGGMTGFQPGSLTANKALSTIGLTSEQLQRMGLQDYGNFVGSVSGTQTVSPQVQSELAATNAMNLSAPDPAQAASYAQGLFDKYLRALEGPAGGTTKTWKDATNDPTSQFNRSFDQTMNPRYGGV